MGLNGLLQFVREGQRGTSRILVIASKAEATNVLEDLVSWWEELFVTLSLPLVGESNVPLLANPVPAVEIAGTGMVPPDWGSRLLMVECNIVLSPKIPVVRREVPRSGRAKLVWVDTQVVWRVGVGILVPLLPVVQVWLISAVVVVLL